MQTVSAGTESGFDTFDALVRTIQARYNALDSADSRRVFVTDAGDLFVVYLKPLPPDRHQHHICSCCRTFLRLFSGHAAIVAPPPRCGLRRALGAVPRRCGGDGPGRTSGADRRPIPGRADTPPITRTHPMQRRDVSSSSVRGPETPHCSERRRAHGRSLQQVCAE